MAGAAAFVYPSLYEGFGLPVLEAMALGVPVLTSRGSSLAEVAGDAALLIDPLSVETIEAALRRVLTEPELALELGRAGRERAAQFPWSRTAAATWEVYRAVRRRAGEKSGVAA
jgi:glycosyltransferase involved in cell wall biosynthesis